jgi:hypothetical protein
MNKPIALPPPFLKLSLILPPNFAQFVFKTNKKFTQNKTIEIQIKAITKIKFFLLKKTSPSFLLISCVIYDYEILNYYIFNITIFIQ